MVDLLGENWYENEDLENTQLIRANEFKTFYEEHGIPTCIKKKNKTKENENEYSLSLWFGSMKSHKKGKKDTGHIYPSVEKILVDLLGENWYENEDLEQNSLQKANEYKDFYEKNNRKPGRIQEPKTEEEKQEKYLKQWFDDMKKTKNEKGLGKLFPSVEKILVDLLGENWYVNKDLEKHSLQKANEYKSFYEKNNRKPIGTSNPGSEDEKTESILTNWFSGMKQAKKGKSLGKLFPSVEKIFVDLLGTKWYENEDFEQNALSKAVEFKAFYFKNGHKPSEKEDQILSKWFQRMKEAKRGVGTTYIYPSVEKILIELLGKNWYENQDLEKQALIKANEYKTFYEENKRKPVGFSDPKTDDEEKEKILAEWFSMIRISKNGKRAGKVYPSVEKILIELLGENWYESSRSEKSKSDSKTTQSNTCTSILKSGPNKGKECGKNNCKKHESPKESTKESPKESTKKVEKPMTHSLPQPSVIQPSEPRAPRPQSQLSLLHKEYKTLRSDNLATKFREQPQLWHEYHRISEANEASFPDGQVPYQRVISFLNTHLATFHPKKQKTIVDMGCGTARVQQAFVDRPNLTFHNLDHISCDERVTVADISHTGLEDGDADVVILCLTMWGSNKEEYVSEAFRLLDPNGRLIIVEPSKRWMDETGHRLREMLIRHGFVIVQEEVMDGDQVHKFSLFVVKK